MIVNYYIEFSKDQRQCDLEEALYKAGFAFYDATKSDPLTTPDLSKNPTGKPFDHIEEIEAWIECK